METRKTLAEQYFLSKGFDFFLCKTPAFCVDEMWKSHPVCKKTPKKRHFGSPGTPNVSLGITFAVFLWKSYPRSQEFSKYRDRFSTSPLVKNRGKIDSKRASDTPRGKFYGKFHQNPLSWYCNTALFSTPLSTRCGKHFVGLDVWGKRRGKDV